MEAITDSEVEAALKRIFAADSFKSSPKLRQFLNYIVKQKLDGNEDLLKAYAIAIDVYNYPEDFDPQIDPIIRVQARRLRTALHEYYLEAGKKDRIRISVPSGHYRPVFSENLEAIVEEPPNPAPDDKGGSKKIDRQYMLACFTIFLLVMGLGFSWFVGSDNHQNVIDRELDAITISMHEDSRNLSDVNNGGEEAFFLRNLRAAMVRNSALSIISPTITEPDNIKTDFVIDISFLESDFIRYVSIELINGHTGQLVWSRSYELSALEGNGITQLVRELNSEIFETSAKVLAGREPETLTAAQLFVLSTWVPGPAKSALKWEKRHIELARLALGKDPEFGPAYSVLADKLAYLAAVDAPSSTSEAIDEAKASAARALELSAGDANALFNVAQYYSHSGQLNNSIAMMKRVLELDPSHGFARFFSIVYPYSCRSVPDDVLVEVVKFDRSFGADNPSRWVTLTWLGWLHLNRGEYAAALKAVEQSAQIFQAPYTIMGHAAILKLMGRTEEAIDLLESHKANWPNLDPEFFAKRTLLRICSDQKQQGKLISALIDLSISMKGSVRDE